MNVERLGLTPDHETETKLRADIGPTFLARTEWWGRLALEIDARINHPLVNGGWLNWLPEGLATAIVWPSYRFCCWAAQWDEPLEPNDPRWIGRDE